MKNINLKAIGWGLFVYIGARAAIQQIAMYAFGLLPDYRLLALISAIDIIIPAMLVGYITAKLSRGNEIKNSLILGVSLYLIAFLFLSLTRPLALPLFGVLGFFFFPPQLPYVGTTYRLIGGILITFALILLGAYLAKKRNQRVTV